MLQSQLLQDYTATPTQQPGYSQQRVGLLWRTPKTERKITPPPVVARTTESAMIIGAIFNGQTTSAIPSNSLDIVDQIIAYSAELGE